MGGFRSPRKVNYEIIQLGDLEEKLEAGAYDVDALRKENVVRSSRPVKLLSGGELKKKFDLSVHAISKGARSTIEKAGGSVRLVKMSGQ